MAFELELDFLRDIFEKNRLRLLILDPQRTSYHEVDMGLRRQLGLDRDHGLAWALFGEQIRPNTIYRITDPFLCTYLILLLPERQGKTLMTVGPYLTVELSREQLLEQVERAGVPPQYFHIIENYFASVPVITESSLVFAPLETFCERIWGGSDNYTMEDINQELYGAGVEQFLPEAERKTEAAELMESMEQMEARYAYENELMQAVAQGQTHKAEMFLSGFSRLSFERRLADPVRNLKNYTIIMNTLMRKAAEQGGVHPLYLDKISSGYAVKIEEIKSMKAGLELMAEIYRAYCRLVKRHSTKNYSAPVQKAIIQIDADLSADLGLKALAEAQGINASYLSALFKKETGQTVTDYVSQKRVRQALRLLSGTRLQIQTIAQHCGIPDVNYFSKIFKKYMGKTPKQFRLDSQQMTPGQNVV